SLEVVTGPIDLENLPRYWRLLSDNPWSVVHQTCKENGKVLWVVNTVDRALKLADEAVARGLAPLVYHSRFRYEDRVRQHGRVIAAFREDGPVLVIMYPENWTGNEDRMLCPRESAEEGR